MTKIEILAEVRKIVDASINHEISCEFTACEELIKSNDEIAEYYDDNVFKLFKAVKTTLDVIKHPEVFSHVNVKPNSIFEYCEHYID